eukprot:COSAG06_NODE_2181_length_7402_cov_8.928933_6_plen_146_part_00
MPMGRDAIRADRGQAALPTGAGGAQQQQAGETASEGGGGGACCLANRKTKATLSIQVSGFEFELLDLNLIDLKCAKLPRFVSLSRLLLQGSAVMFSGKNRHRGVPITSGVRYILGTQDKLAGKHLPLSGSLNRGISGSNGDGWDF